MNNENTMSFIKSLGDVNGINYQFVVDVIDFVLCGGEWVEKGSWHQDHDLNSGIIYWGHDSGNTSKHPHRSP